MTTKHTKVKTQYVLARHAMALVELVRSQVITPQEFRHFAVLFAHDAAISGWASYAIDQLLKSKYQEAFGAMAVLKPTITFRGSRVSVARLLRLQS